MRLICNKIKNLRLVNKDYLKLIKLWLKQRTQIHLIQTTKLSSVTILHVVVRCKENLLIAPST